MKPIVIILGIVFWIILQVVKANRKNAARGGQNNNNSGESGQNFIDQLTQAASQMQQNPSAAPQNQQRDSSRPNLSIQDSFWNTNPITEVANVEADHFREESLVEEYKRTRREGRTIQHHTHDYFDETKDRKKAEKHNSSNLVQRSARLENKTLSAKSSNKNVSKKKPAKPKPFLIDLKDKAAFKQAFILSEILNRPH